MTVLVDTAKVPAHGGWWSHLASDHSADELHRFAVRLGVPRRAFEGDHYDVPDHLVGTAVELGAELVTTRELLRRVRAAGLRTPKRRGEKVLTTTSAGGRRVDVVRARVVPLPHGVHRIARLDPAGRLHLADGDLPVVDELPGSADPGGGGVVAGVVVGFRRRWIRHDGAFDLRHDGIVLAAALPVEPPDGFPRDLPDRWWTPLLRPED